MQLILITDYRVILDIFEYQPENSAKNYCLVELSSKKFWELLIFS